MDWSQRDEQLHIIWESSLSKQQKAPSFTAMPIPTNRHPILARRVPCCTNALFLERSCDSVLSFSRESKGLGPLSDSPGIMTTENLCWSLFLLLRFGQSLTVLEGFPRRAQCKESANVVDVSSIPGWGRPPGEGNGNPLQYSCLGNSTDRGTWRATVHEVTKSRTWLSSYAYGNGLELQRNLWICFLRS